MFENNDACVIHNDDETVHQWCIGIMVMAFVTVFLSVVMVMVRS